MGKARYCIKKKNGTAILAFRWLSLKRLQYFTE